MKGINGFVSVISGHQGHKNIQTRKERVWKTLEFHLSTPFSSCLTQSIFSEINIKVYSGLYVKCHPNYSLTAKVSILPYW
jgi:hypothetical protein